MNTRIHKYTNRHEYTNTHSYNDIIGDRIIVLHEYTNTRIDMNTRIHE